MQEVPCFCDQSLLCAKNISTFGYNHKPAKHSLPPSLSVLLNVSNGH